MARSSTAPTYRKTVEAEPLRPLVRLLLDRFGYAEAARRVGCTSPNLWYIVSGKTRRVRQDTARGILLTSWPFTERAHRINLDSRICATGGCGRFVDAIGERRCWTCRWLAEAA